MLNIGIVGLGRIGKIHLSNVQRYIPNAKVIAACPVRKKDESFLKLNGVYLHFESYEKMIKVKNIDAVIIASPTAFHFDHIMIAMNEGKHIFCEKQVELSCKKVEMLKELINESGIQFMVGFNRRFDPHINQLKIAYCEGRVGKARILKITSRDPKPPPLEFIKNSGGLFLDMTIHDIDMARYLVGDEVIQVSSNGTVFGDLPLGKYDDIDTAAVTLIFKNGCLVQIDNSRYCSYGYDQRIEVFGEKGKLVTNNVLENSVQISNSSGQHGARAKYFFLERYVESYRNILIDFVENLLNNKPSSISIEDGLAALSIAKAAKKSLQQNQPITII